MMKETSIYDTGSMVCCTEMNHDDTGNMPARHYRPAWCLPLIFSLLARSMARISSNNKVTHKVQNSRFPGNNLPSSSGGRMVNHGQIDNSEYSSSSDDEEFDRTVQADLSSFIQNQVISME
ncbi:hypothetical protein P3S68_015926 [Capsicum galapagoense]